MPFIVKLKLPPDWPIAPNETDLAGLSLVTVIIRLPVSVIAVLPIRRFPLLFKPMLPFISTTGFLTAAAAVEDESVPELRIKVPRPVPASPAVMRVPESRVVFPVKVLFPHRVIMDVAEFCRTDTVPFPLEITERALEFPI